MLQMRPKSMYKLNMTIPFPDQIIQLMNQKAKYMYGLTIPKLTPGIFSEGLKLRLLKECSPSVDIHVAEGCYAHGKPQHTDAYTTFLSIFPVIFPWTATFSSSKTTQDNLKVVLSKLNAANGVEIPISGKKKHFSLPAKSLLQQMTFVILQCRSWARKWIIVITHSSSSTSTYLNLLLI